MCYHGANLKEVHMTTEREQIKTRLKEGAKELKKIQQGSRNSEILEIIQDVIEQKDHTNIEDMTEESKRRDKAAMPREEYSETI